MGLLQQLDEDLKDAMRGRDRLRSDAIRQVKSAVTYAGIQQGKELADGEIQEVISRLVRQHRESIAMFGKGNRQELVEKEEAELKILLSYLPQQLSTEELRELAKGVAREIGARGPADRGKVMGKLMPQVKGRAEGKTVNDVVTEVLANLAGAG